MAGFTIPNRDDAAFEVPQSQIYELDLQILARNSGSTVSGCAVTAQSTPDMTVAVAAGILQAAGMASVVVTSGNLSVTASDAMLWRLDLVTVSAAGVKTYTAGTAAAIDAVKPPALPGGHLCLAFLTVPPTTTEIGSDQIVDKRTLAVAVPQVSAVPSPVQIVSNAYTSGTSIALTVAAPSVGNPLLMLVASTGRVCNSITQTNVVWTKLLTDNGNSRYFEVWTGVVSSSPGTTATLAFTGTNECAATFIELPSTAPAFTTAGTPLTATSASATLYKLENFATVAGDWVVWGIVASGASSYSGMSQSYLPIMAFGGYERFGILQAIGTIVSLWSVNVSAGAFNGVLVKIS